MAKIRNRCIYIYSIIIVTWTGVLYTSSGLAQFIGSHETRRVDGDLMIWANPRDMILYASSSYNYNNMFVICLFPTLFWFCKLLWSLIQKNCENVCHNVTFHDVTSSYFRRWLHALNLQVLYVKLPQKTGNRFSLVLKDSYIESEYLSSLIWLSVLDGQKADSSKDISFIDI